LKRANVAGAAARGAGRGAAAGARSGSLRQRRQLQQRAGQGAGLRATLQAAVAVSKQLCPACCSRAPYVWQLHWQIVWLQTHAPKDVQTSDADKEDIALRYRLFCSTLQRHVAMPLNYVHDVFSVLIQDVLLRKAVGQAVYD